LIVLAIRSILETARTIDSLDARGVKSYLADQRSNVEARDSEVVALFQELASLPIGTPTMTSAVLSQTCSFFFMLLHDVHRHPLADELVPDVLDAWRASAGLNVESLDAAVPQKSAADRQWQKWGLPPSILGGVPPHGSQDDFLTIFRAKTSMWGCYLLSQFLVTGALRVAAMNDMAVESVDLRQSYAWSVPSPEALELIAAQGPLVEVGAGRGLWAELLQKRGAEVRAFNLTSWDTRFGDAPEEGGKEGGTTRMPKPGSGSCVVEEGGPEALMGLGASFQSLVLMWPDYGGKGTFGLDCARTWLLQENGKRLICVGEWAGKGTFGAMGTPGWAEHGQSFSRECQAFVEEHCRLVSSIALPNWPLFLDAVQIFERRS